MRYVLAEKPSALLVVGLAFFTDALVYAMLPPLLPEYARGLGLSQTRLGLLFGSYAAALLLATLPLGTWADRSGRRGPFLGATAGFGAATVLFAFAGSFPMLVLARVFQGVAAAATWVAGLALVADIFPAEQRGKAMSTVFACANLGFFLGPGYSGWMVEVWSVRGAFLAVAGLALLDAAARLTLLPEEPSAPIRGLGYLALLKDGAIRVFAGSMGLGAVLGAAVEAILPLHFSRHLGLDAAAIGLAFTTAALASMFTSPLVGHWTDRRGAGGPVTLGVVLGTCLLGLAPFLPGRAAVHLFMLAMGAACSLLMSPAGPALGRRVERMGGAAFGSVFSLLNVTFSLGVMVGPILGSALVDLVGLKATMAILAAGFAAYLLPLSAHRQDDRGTAAVPD
jgi:DHA1 family solute carrier family 18 vesicular amine transporter 1/2